MEDTVKTMSIGRRGNIRQDYNENHDERGRFSVSESSAGSDVKKVSTMPFGDKAAAKSYAKRASSASKDKTFHVSNHISTGSSAVLHSYYQGKEIQAGAKGNPGVSGQSGTYAAVSKELTGLAQLGDKSAAGALKGMAQGKYDKVIGESSHMGVTELADMVKDLHSSNAMSKVRSPDGVAMRAEKGDKEAIKELAAYKAAGAKDTKAISAALKGRYNAAGQKIGGHVALNDKQFARLTSKGSYTVLTPANPMSKQLSPKENAERMKAAVKDLNKMGAKYVITAGKYGHSEPGFTVLHDEKFGVAQARELGRKYNQTSVMHVENGKATIYHTTGQFAGRVQRSTGFSFEPGATDNFTQHGAVKYSFHFPDDSWGNPEKE